MTKSKALISLAAGAAAAIIMSVNAQTVSGQQRRPAARASICGDPRVPCKTSVTFQAYTLPFRVPEKAVIYDTELFYAVILKSVGVGENDCDVFVSESERLQTQSLFVDHKVFTSRCTDAGEMFFTGMSPRHRFMAVYAGKTPAEANRMLAAVKAKGKFPGANIRRMRTGFNGT